MAGPADVILERGARGQSIEIAAVMRHDWPKRAETLPARVRRWAKANGFAGEPGRFLTVAGEDGEIAGIWVGLDPDGDPFALGRLARLLPRGTYRLAPGTPNARLAVIGWGLEAYDFAAYRGEAPPPARLICPADVDRAEVLRAVEAAWLTRDLVNTPASDMGPDELEAAALHLARRFKASCRTVSGKPLERQFPMIHAVGKASARQPRLVDFVWGPARAPKVTLVGKGVCFDTGGLDIKPASGMALMKKDMGGAATVLGLAQMVMSAKLPVRLRVLLPIVENAIAGNAFRPGDILKSRKGITVEIGNTDAEGRLILGDALALADADKPDLLVDMATLTGAARVALGPDLPPFYTDDDGVAAALAEAARRENDPLWRMPFWQPYARLFESPVADMNNSSESGFAGSITAALFLKRFVEHAKAYVHFDIFAWTPSARAGRPRGAEAQGQRALFALICNRYAK